MFTKFGLEEAKNLEHLASIVQGTDLAEIEQRLMAQAVARGYVEVIDRSTGEIIEIPLKDAEELFGSEV